MTASTLDLRELRLEWRESAPFICTAAVFLVLFWSPLSTLVQDWWRDPDAGHGLLLAPLAVYLAWKRGIVPEARPNPLLGLAVLSAAVILRYVSELAAEVFTMRASMLAGVGALVLFWLGLKQVLHWWLPSLLLLFCIPLPAVLLNSLALPLQLQASQFGAALLESRHVPVLLSGNVIHLPGRSLFVTEACSGLRSLSALLALGVLIGGLWFRLPLSRVVLVLLSIPIAMVLNGLRIFITGFLVYHIDPAMGEGFIHYTEGWLIFVAALLALGGAAWVILQAEQAWIRNP